MRLTLKTLIASRVPVSLKRLVQEKQAALKNIYNIGNSKQVATRREKNPGGNGD